MNDINWIELILFNAKNIYVSVIPGIQYISCIFEHIYA